MDRTKKQRLADLKCRLDDEKYRVAKHNKKCVTRPAFLTVYLSTEAAKENKANLIRTNRGYILHGVTAHVRPRPTCYAVIVWR